MPLDFPTKDRKRAARRHHRQRMYEKTKSVGQNIYNIKNDFIEDWSKKTMKNRKKCSCLLCCGPRRLYGNSKYGKSIQEVKHEYKDDE